MSEVFNTKEVFFSEYCLKCKYGDLKETEEPCDECLSQGWNENSHKPINFKEDE